MKNQMIPSIAFENIFLSGGNWNKCNFQFMDVPYIRYYPVSGQESGIRLDPVSCIRYKTISGIIRYPVSGGISYPVLSGTLPIPACQTP